MAGTDRTREPGAAGESPVIILVDPQLGENIGMVARAMLNCGFTELRLVRPRDGWPSDKAIAAASGADQVVDGARLFDTTEAAIADLTAVYATTARPRGMTKPVYAPDEAAPLMAEDPASTGILFGGEAKGLKNDDIALADAIIMAPLNPQFSSLNLAQAVLLVAHEFYKLGLEPADDPLEKKGTRPATKEELLGFYEHLESALDGSGFLHVKEKRPTMVRNLRNLFGRARLTEQEVRTLRGIIASLVKHKPGK